jgi:hypothetical protein
MNSTSPPWQQLARQLREPSFFYSPSQHCRAYQSQLPVFIADELARLPVDRLYPQVTNHLNLCPFCLHAYEELSQLTSAALWGEDSA